MYSLVINDLSHRSCQLFYTALTGPKLRRVCAWKYKTIKILLVYTGLEAAKWFTKWID